MPNYTPEQHLVKNFWQGRGEAKPLAIVEHMMQGTLEETAAIFDGKPTNDGHSYKVSAHYGVARDGRIWQFVRDEDTAWANGVLSNPDPALDWLQASQPKFNANVVTLSIEYEGFTDEAFTEAQYEAALALHQQLVQRWQIPADADHIVGHDRLDATERSSDPGPAFPWARLLTDLHSAQSATLAEAAVSEKHAEMPQFAYNQPDFNSRELSTKPLTETPQPTFAEPAQPSFEYAVESQPEINAPELAADQNSPASSSLPPVLEEDLSEYYRLDDILAQSADFDIQPEQEDTQVLALDDILAQARRNENNTPTQTFAIPKNSEAATQPENATNVNSSSASESEGERFELPDWLKDETAAAPAQPTTPAINNVATNVEEPPAQSAQSAFSNLGVPVSSSAALPEDDALLPLDLSDLLEETPVVTANSTATPAIDEPQATPKVSETVTAPQATVFSQPQAETKPQISTQATQTTPVPEKFAGVDNAIRQNLGTGIINVELANIRNRPSFEEETISRTADENERFHFDAYAEGPALNDSVYWLHIAAADGDGWIHSSLVTLDNQDIHFA